MVHLDIAAILELLELLGIRATLEPAGLRAVLELLGTAGRREHRAIAGTLVIQGLLDSQGLLDIRAIAANLELLVTLVTLDQAAHQATRAVNMQSESSRRR